MNNDNLNAIPNAVEIEDRLLSCAMVDEYAAHIIFDSLSPDDMFRSSNKTILSAMKRTFKAEGIINLPMTVAALREAHKLESVGGVEGVAKLIDEIPMSTDVETHIRIVKEKAALRHIIKSCSDAIRESNNMTELSTVLAHMEKAVKSADGMSGKDNFAGLADINLNMMQDLEKKAANIGTISGVPTGIAPIDRMLEGWQKTDLNIIAARPSMGKTSLALKVTKTAAEAGKGVAVFSLEMSKEQLNYRLVSMETGINSLRFRSGGFSQHEWSKINDAAGKMSELPIYIDDEGGLHVDEVVRRAGKISREKKIDMIVIDYLQLMKGEGENQNIRVGYISAALKAMAKKLNVPVIALSQLNRKVDDRAEKIPTLSDIRDSGSIEQDTDVVIFIHRDEFYTREKTTKPGLADIYLAKNRNGPTGEFEMRFIKEQTLFTMVDDPNL